MTSGQIEALAAEVVNRFFQDSIGRGSTTIRASLMPRSLVVRLSGVLTPAEARLTRRDQPDRQRAESIVREMRDRIVRAGRDELAAALLVGIGRQPSAVLHDLDPGSGEEVMVFTFASGADGPEVERARRPRGDRRTIG